MRKAAREDGGEPPSKKARAPKAAAAVKSKGRGRGRGRGSKQAVASQECADGGVDGKEAEGLGDKEAAGGEKPGAVGDENCEKDGGQAPAGLVCDNGEGHDTKKGGGPRKAAPDPNEAWSLEAIAKFTASSSYILKLLMGPLNGASMNVYIYTPDRSHGCERLESPFPSVSCPLRRVTLFAMRAQWLETRVRLLPAPLAY